TTAVVDERTHAIVMTHNFLRDKGYLRSFLASPAGYIAMLGPAARTQRLLMELREEGATATDDDLARVHGPAGLDLGAEGPEERDDDAHRVVLAAKGMEQRGKGAANASVTSWLEPAGDGATAVKMEADITLTGAVAQLSRGLLPDVSAKLTQQFADCLQATMQAQGAADAANGASTGAPASIPAVTAKPVGGIRLGLSALLRTIGRSFRRLFSGKPTE